MPQADTRLGDHYERLVRRECDAIGEMQPGQHDLDPPTQVAAHEPAGAGVLQQVALPMLQREPGRRVAEPDGAVAGDRRVVTHAQRPAVDQLARTDQFADRAGPRVDAQQPSMCVADHQRAVGVHLDPERAPDGCWPLPPRGQ